MPELDGGICCESRLILTGSYKSIDLETESIKLSSYSQNVDNCISNGLYFGPRQLALTREYLAYSNKVFKDSLIKNLFVDLRAGICIETKEEC